MKGLDDFRMHIDGKWVEGSGREYQDIINPATGKVIAAVPKGTEEDVNLAVRAARDAFDDVWFDSTPRDRSEREQKSSHMQPWPAHTALTVAQSPHGPSYPKPRAAGRNIPRTV